MTQSSPAERQSSGSGSGADSGSTGALCDPAGFVASTCAAASGGTAAGPDAAATATAAAAYGWDFVTPGLPDGAFEDAPGFSPTPMELRVMLLAHLRPRADSLVWDVGGGTGALALEIARLMPAGAVHTLERDPEAVELLERNRRRFGIANLHIHAGRAPDDLARLPEGPDRVLLEVGRPLVDVLRAVWGALRPGGRLVISTANLEGLVDATDTLGQLDAHDVQVVQATVHRMQRRGSQAKFAAAEPLFVIAAER